MINHLEDLSKGSLAQKLSKLIPIGNVTSFGPRVSLISIFRFRMIHIQLLPTILSKIVDLLVLTNFHNFMLKEVMRSPQNLAGSEIVAQIMQLERTVDNHSIRFVFDGCFWISFVSVWLSFVFLPEQFLFKNKLLGRNLSGVFSFMSEFELNLPKLVAYGPSSVFSSVKKRREGRCTLFSSTFLRSWLWNLWLGNLLK